MHGADELVLRDLDRGVLLLTWNRPERNNGWTIDLEEAFFGALVDASADPDVRVIVVTGAGRSFCPGLDTETLAAATGGTPMATVRRWPLNLVRFVPKPVIVAVNGACAGIGFIQAVACDLCFASSSAKFTSAFARRGLPAENSISWMLPRLVGTANAMDLLLSARTGARRRGAAAGSRQPGGAARRPAGGHARVRPRSRRQLLAQGHGRDQAAGARRLGAQQRAEPHGSARRGGRVDRPLRLQGRRDELQGEAPASVRRAGRRDGRPSRAGTADRHGADLAEDAGEPGRLRPLRRGRRRRDVERSSADAAGGRRGRPPRLRRRAAWAGRRRPAVEHPVGIRPVDRRGGQRSTAGTARAEADAERAAFPSSPGSTDR